MCDHGRLNTFKNVNTDSRKKIMANIYLNGFWGSRHTVQSHDIGADIRFQPSNALSIILSGSYGTYWRRQDQFVENVVYNNSPRTIVASVKQKTLRFVTRLNYNITPDLTLQYYGQPFITRPLYEKFAYVTDPNAKKYENRFVAFAPAQIISNAGEYSVDENADGTADYSFAKPDFNFVQFRSNLVARWEYKPGSELYLVWSQGNTASAFDELNTPIANSLFSNALAGQPRNIFLVKWTYRFLR
jgi:hypothetical protein